MANKPEKETPEDDDPFFPILRAMARSLTIQALAVAPVTFENNHQRIAYVAGLGHEPAGVAAILGISVQTVHKSLAGSRPAAPRKKTRRAK